MNITSKPLSRTKFLFVILVVVVILFNFTTIGTTIRNTFLSAVSPFQSAFWSKGISLHNKTNENNSDYSALIAEIVRLKRETKEMDALREALDLEIKKDFNFLDAKVIGKSTAKDQLIISRGTDDGIIKGMPVITSSRSLIGEVVEVLSDFSFVKLISHPETEFDAKILDKENSLGVLVGGENLILEMVSREIAVEKGDIVITHPGGGFYPGGIFIGEVEKVIQEDAQAFQKLKIKPGFNLNKLDTLFIITDF